MTLQLQPKPDIQMSAVSNTFLLTCSSTTLQSERNPCNKGTQKTHVPRLPGSIAGTQHPGPGRQPWHAGATQNTESGGGEGDIELPMDGVANRGIKGGCVSCRPTFCHSFSDAPRDVGSTDAQRSSGLENHMLGEGAIPRIATLGPNLFGKQCSSW